MADLFDVIELIVDIPDRHLRAGMQGTIVHVHADDVYEVEFTDESGETLDLLALPAKQLIVVWRADKKEWVPVADRVAALLMQLPEETRQEVLDFARFLAVRGRQRVASAMP